MHYNHQSPGIDLISVGKCCPNLTEFSVCDSLVSAPNLMIVHASYRLFSHLFSLKLLRVSYSHQDDWEAIPRQVTFLLKIHSRVEGILNKSSLCADHVLSKQIWRFGLYYFILNTLGRHGNLIFSCLLFVLFEIFFSNHGILIETCLF